MFVMTYFIGKAYFEFDSFPQFGAKHQKAPNDAGLLGSKPDSFSAAEKRAARFGFFRKDYLPLRRAYLARNFSTRPASTMRV